MIKMVHFGFTKLRNFLKIKIKSIDIVAVKKQKKCFKKRETL